ncbi:hypothetical protein [Desulfovibrio ferrophilus]|uniref:Uncharacterized protein n=1 Tax=Desulfovibrio ferrophilus TaxID=241368 RepID=A0A2Z6B0P8_9BACT|nr:hypothetical protein [Desulfovibrio ferrophilus]BBD09054.1 uncharacterized protein DFE_2328 [Desulfovibrio ferrophilus]
MGSVIALEQYKKRQAPEKHLDSVLYPRPRINDSEIFSKDFTRLENVVFAILKVREILRYHVHSNEEWQYLILCVLDAAYYFDAQKSQLLKEATTTLKDYILDETNARNGKDMTSALLLMDLIEKSPRMKKTAPTD